MRNYSEIDWELVLEVFQPEEAQLISGLLETAGVPVQLEMEAVGQIYGFTVGPLARIGILVPKGHKAEAEAILSNATPEGEE